MTSELHYSLLWKPTNTTDYISATEGIMMVVYSFNLQRRHNGEYLFKYSLWPNITVLKADGIRSMREKKTNPLSLKRMKAPFSYSVLNMGLLHPH